MDMSVDPVNPYWAGPGSYLDSILFSYNGGQNGALGLWESKSIQTLGLAILLSSHSLTG